MLMEQFSDVGTISNLGTIFDYNTNYIQINWSQITLLWIDV